MGQITLGVLDVLAVRLSVGEGVGVELISEHVLEHAVPLVGVVLGDRVEDLVAEVEGDVL